MQDREFFDLIYSQWAKTTGAEDTFWVVEDVGSGEFNIYSVNENEEQVFVAALNSEDDADWIAALHGCFADLTRRMNEALDEADRLDETNDENIGRVASMELETSELEHQLELKDQEIQRLYEANGELVEEIRHLEDELSFAMGDA